MTTPATTTADAAPSSPGMRAFLGYLAGRYPARTARTVALLGLSGLTEGVGVLTLLPLIATVADGDEEPSGIANVMNDVLDAVGLADSLAVLLGVIFLSTAVKSGLLWLALREAGNAAADLAADLRRDLVGALLDAEWRHFTKEQVGSLANAMSSEAIRASSVYVVACRLLANVIQVAVYALLALLVAPTVTLAALGAGVVMFGGLNRLVRAARRAGKGQTEALSSLIVRLADGLLAMKPLKAMGQEDLLRPILEHDISLVNEAQRREVAANALLPATQEPLIVGIMGVGAWFAISRADVEFATLLFTAFLFYRTVSRLAVLQYHQQTIAAYDSAFWSLRASIERAIAAHEDLPGGTMPPRLQTAIRFDDLSFDHGGAPVLDHFSATVPSHRFTVVVGPSGSGKTTLVDLVAGLYRASSGDIWIDDVPLSTIDIRAWRKRIGYVPQEPVFFHDSVLVNVALGADGVGTDEVERALRLAGAAPFVAELEDGLATIIGERGGRLSGGQRQRLALARALVRRPDLLVLDEATTGLDAETERAVCETLRSLREETTILAVSHQRSVIELADIVIELPDLAGAPAS